MTVKELIQQLQKLPPDNEIWTLDDGWHGVPGLQVEDDDGEELAFVPVPDPIAWTKWANPPCLWDSRGLPSR